MLGLRPLFQGLLPAMKSPRWEDGNEWRLVLAGLKPMEGHDLERKPTVFREGCDLFMKLHWCSEEPSDEESCPVPADPKGSHAEPPPVERLVAGPAYGEPQNEPDLVPLLDGLPDGWELVSSPVEFA